MIVSPTSEMVRFERGLCPRQAFKLVACAPAGPSPRPALGSRCVVVDPVEGSGGGAAVAPPQDN